MKKMTYLSLIVLITLFALGSCMPPPDDFSTENEAPIVSAMNDFTMFLGDSVNINADVSDDGLPNPPSTTSLGWSKISGPGNVIFTSPNNYSTNVTFDTEGDYVLRLTAHDGELSGYDDILVTVGTKTLTYHKVGEWINISNSIIEGRIIIDYENSIPYAYMPYGSSSDFDGSITFGLNVTELGLYKLIVLVNSPSQSNNSFFVGLSSENAKGNDYMSWDTATSGSFIEDEVSWRSSSSSTRIDPKVWELDVGLHEIVFYGREPNTRLARIILVKVDDEIQCTCSEWKDSIVGGGSCSSSQMLQTRTCTPTSCDVTERCIEYSSPGEEIRLFETVEKTFSNPTISGNPYDLIATAEFTHVSSGEKIITELYYVGSNNYKFKFTATKLGTWNYVTKSSDSDLNGKSGSFNVVPQTNTNVNGFLTHSGNKFVMPDYQGNLKAYLFNILMNLENYGTLSTQLNTDEKVNAYLDEAEDTGFTTIFVSIGIPSVWMTGSSGNVDPNLVTFERLERVIRMTHQRGMHVHIWLWGDKEAGTSPVNYDGGINGYVDRRLQRYIAARIGPMPGWSMGYGYDLHEWTTISQLESWASFMHDKFAYDHLLSTRAYKLSSSANNINSYESFGRSVPLTTTTYGPKDYAEVLADIQSDTSRPLLYEERHTYLRPNYDLDMEGTRRLLWWQAMAGGVGGFYGYYRTTTSVYRGHPYPNPEQIRAHRDFWKTRFELDMVPCNDLTSDGIGLCGRGKYYVFYKENTNSISFDLSHISGSFTVTALNTKTGDNINVGTKTNSYNKFVAPMTSDWVVYVKPI